MTFTAPLKDITFALDACAGGGDLDAETRTAILDAAGVMASETLAPLNRRGDRAGVKLADGAVTSAPGFREAYAEFRQGGWQGLCADPAYGGQGLPRTIALAVMEMVHAANMSFGLCPMLTLGAIEALEQHGTPQQKQHYLAKLIAGEWTGTMNLTEPHAGSDVGALSTKAVAQPGGAYALTGQKIFITWGEHDLTSNIVHLVLARIEGAPPGSKGVSLFLAPKILPDGSRNALRCIGVEEKMGIHASPTCTMAFEGATAWLVGEENRGLAAMFTMMNAARLNVGLEGVAVAEAAFQKALSYANERKQGGAFIAEHPDVRRMLVTMKAKTQAARMLCYACAAAADAGAKAREDVLTPLAKAWSTEAGVEAASLGVQVHGGMGYVEDGGAAQFYRDARIAPIYEGTNGIQAIDLYGRKLLGDRGAAMLALIGECEQAGAALGGDDGSALVAAAGVLRAATDYMLAAERLDALCGASEYLMLSGDVVSAGLWARGLLSAPDRQDQRALFAHFAGSVLSSAQGRFDALQRAAVTLFDPALGDLSP